MRTGSSSLRRHLLPLAVSTLLCSLPFPQFLVGSERLSGEILRNDSTRLASLERLLTARMPASLIARP
jgi:hypothetical protein